MSRIILASMSPRRRDLMRLIPIEFEVCAVDIDETIDNAISPKENAIELAKLKAKAAKEIYDDAIIIGCDTIVAIGDRILGKPHDEDDARRILLELSGAKHRVYTGVCILVGDDVVQFCGSADVVMKTLSDDEISWYIDTGEPMDKAGAYGIQGHGSLFVRRINGDYYSVVGLPICQLNSELKNIIG